MNTPNVNAAQRAQMLSLLGLPQAWAGRSSYTLLDLDDEYGSRFVTLWSQWRRDPRRCSRLHVVLVLENLASPSSVLEHCSKVLSVQAYALAKQMVEQWPLNMPGMHRLEFEALSVTLTLAVGPISVMLKRLDLAADAVLFAQTQLAEPPRGRADAALGLGRLIKPAAVLLAGGSARMWPAWFEASLLFHEQAAHPSPSPTPTSSTGDTQERTPTVILRARASPHSVAGVESIASASSATMPRHLVVVGGGLAGLHVAQALALRGWRVTVLNAGIEHAPQAGHLAAALTPVVSRQDDSYARLSRAGSLRAQARWSQMPREIVTPCGALQLQRLSGRIVDLRRIVDELKLPEQFVRFVDVAQASELAGLSLARGGLYFSTARRVQPGPLLAKLAQVEGVTCLHAEVVRLERGGQQWRAIDATGRVVIEAEQMVLAAGLATQKLLAASALLATGSRLASLYGLGGELTYVDQGMLAGGPRCIVSGDGYVLPAVQGQCVIGGSYLNGDLASAEAASLARQENLERGAQLLNVPLSRSARTPSLLKGWGGQRAVVPDRFPVVGPVLGAPGLFVATGFASRGLTWASLVGDLIAASLTNEPPPLENDIIARISKN